jgi:hypothetical protein
VRNDKRPDAVGHRPSSGCPHAILAFTSHWIYLALTLIVAGSVPATCVIHFLVRKVSVNSWSSPLLAAQVG